MTARRAPERRLLVFGKRPEPGRTKTRLAPDLGEEAAATLYAAFLADTLAAARAVCGDAVELWVPRAPDVREALERRFPDVPLRWQAGPDLGARLSAAFAAAFSDGVDHALVVGSDHPTLPSRYLRRAFRALRSAPLVLGPAHDGGYYAVGLRRSAWPAGAELFRNVPWSTPRVLAITRQRAEARGFRHVQLPEWYDVDRPPDLERLRRDVRPGTATAAALRALERGEPPA